jgi:oligopeptide/dipeptide ABC transporter ATP-binding protein
MVNVEAPPLIEACTLTKDFRLDDGKFLSQTHTSGAIRAVDGVSFQISPGESLALVGESGCGKSTIARLVLGLHAPSSGQVLFKGREVRTLDHEARADYRRSVSAVFQDPWSSLNPWMRIEQIVAEPIEINTRSSRVSIRRRVGELLEDVGLGSRQAQLYPHELSGGQRQRVSIARALALQPELVVLDEPVSALDVSIRAQVMNLLKDLQLRHGLSYLLIAHHLATVKFLCETLAVIYLGRILEQGRTREVLANPRHPYTQGLIAAALPAARRSGRGAPLLEIEGEVPSPANPPSGCHFRTRCPYAYERCTREVPQLAGEEHGVRCFLFDPASAQGQSV